MIRAIVMVMVILGLGNAEHPADVRVQRSIGVGMGDVNIKAHARKQ